MSQLNYVKLIEDVKKGDHSAYNDLCMDFLRYVPVAIDDLGVLFKKSSIDMNDIHQEGYLAICEAIRDIVNSPKSYNNATISKYVLDKIVGRIVEYYTSQQDYNRHIINRDLQYSDFYDFMSQLQENENLRNTFTSYITIVGLC